MQTYHLKSESEQELKDALAAEGLSLVDDGGEHHFAGTTADGFTIDWIGEIYRQDGTDLVETGETDEFGDPVYEEIPRMVSVGGFHCNVYSRFALPANIQQYVIDAPATPARKLAGA